MIFEFCEKKGTSWACLLRSELKLIFHWKVRLFILFKSSFKFFADKSLSNITEKGNVSSAKTLGSETKFSDKLFEYIKKSSGPRTEPWGILASTLSHIEFWQFRTTLCFLSFKKFAKVFSKLTATPFRFNLWIRPFCETLLKALDMSRKTFLTSIALSKDSYNNWLIHESLGLKPDRLEEINPFSMKYSYNQAFEDFSTNWK